MQRLIPLLVVIVIALSVSFTLPYGDSHTSGDPIATRIVLMKDIGDNAKALKTKLDAGRFGEAALNAQTIALRADHILEWFPEGSLSDQSRAKEDIWQKWKLFGKSAQTLRDEANQLVQTIADGKADMASVQAARIFRTCKSCHDRFRAPVP